MSHHGSVVALCIAPNAGDPMQSVMSVNAIAGAGLEGDRYCTGGGSWNKGKTGKRQVTLISARYFPNSGFTYDASRRNIITSGDIELMWLIGRDFTIGDTCVLRGVKYCDPCPRPSKLSGNPRSFKEAFIDAGGLVAEIITSGPIAVHDRITPPPKDYG